MNFVYQAAEERLNRSRKAAQLYLNPESSQPNITVTRENSNSSVSVSLRYRTVERFEDGSEEIKHERLQYIEPLIEQYVRAMLPDLINRALKDLEANAVNQLIAAKEHLQTELARVATYEGLINEGQ